MQNFVLPGLGLLLRQPVFIADRKARQCRLPVSERIGIAHFLLMLRSAR